MAELFTGTVTFLFTDIEGSTRLLREHRARYGEALDDHNRLIRAAVDERGGRELDTQGDAFFIAFPRAKDAVAAAADAQRAIVGHDWPDGIAMRVRMGIHTGEPALTEERYIGLAVHRAARICAAAHGGQILLSSTTTDLVSDELPSGVSLRVVGDVPLKDFDQPERLSQLVVEGLPQVFSPPHAMASEPAVYTGREDELVAAAESVVSSEGRSWRSLVSRPILWAPVLLAVLLLAGVVAIVSRGSEASTAAPQSLVAIDPATNRTSREIGLGASPSDALFADGKVWLSDRVGGTLIRVDAHTREVKTVGLGLPPDAMAVGTEGISVSSAPTASNRTSVSRVSPAREAVATTVTLNHDWYETFVASGSGAVWVSVNPRLYRLDRRSLETVKEYSGLYASAIAAGGDTVWVAEPDDEVLTRLDPSTDEITSIPLAAAEPRAVAVGRGAVWVADLAKDTVWKVDPIRNQVADTIEVGDGPGWLALGFGSLWVANRFDGTVSRIDLTTNKVSETIRVGKNVAGITVGAGRVWVAVP